MIVKNISPHPCNLPSLKVRLMPGDQADLGKFSQQQRDNCYELQNAFQKGELICIGLTHPSGSSGKLRAARARLLEDGASQPLLPTPGTSAPMRGGRVSPQEDDSFLREEVGEITEEELEEDFKYKYNRKPGAQIVGPPEDCMVQQDKHGTIYIQPLPKKESTEDKKSYIINPQDISITKERAREILSQRCIGITQKNRQCILPALPGYDFCIRHLPKDLLKEYKENKQNKFFKDE